MSELRVNDAARELLARWQVYWKSRIELLSVLGITASNRDPLSEFSEVLVAALLGAERTKNRVQKGYDLEGPGGEPVEVKYLSNPTGEWVNWHVIQRSDTWHKYAVVFFTELRPTTVIVFAHGYLDFLYDALGKRHKGRGESLEITSGVFRALVENPARFKDFGVEVVNLGGAVA